MAHYGDPSFIPGFSVGICGGQGHTLTGFSVNPSVFAGLFTHAFIHHRRHVRLATDSVAK